MFSIFINMKKKNKMEQIILTRNNAQETGYKNNNGIFIRHSFNDQPAVVKNDLQIWFKHGVMHRDGKEPSWINGKNDKRWSKEGRYHREDGPAIIYANGTCRYYQDGELHREDGPAIINNNNNESSFFITGIRVDQQIVENPSSQTIQQITNEENIEVRRIRIERFGWENFLLQGECKIIAKGENDIEFTKEAIVKVGPNNFVQRFFLGACPSTGRIFAMELPENINTTKQARQYLSNLNPDRCLLAT